MSKILNNINTVSKQITKNKLKQLQIEENLLFNLAIETIDLTLRSKALQRKKDIDRLQIEILGG